MWLSPGPAPLSPPDHLRTELSHELLGGDWAFPHIHTIKCRQLATLSNKPHSRQWGTFCSFTDSQNLLPQCSTWEASNAATLATDSGSSVTFTAKHTAPADKQVWRWIIRGGSWAHAFLSPSQFGRGGQSDLVGRTWSPILQYSNTDLWWT